MIYEIFKKWFDNSEKETQTIKETPIILPKIKYDIRDILHTKEELYQFVNCNCKPISLDEYEVYKSMGETTHNTLIKDFKAYKNIYPDNIVKTAIKIDDKCYLYEYDNSTPIYKMPHTKCIIGEYNNEQYAIFSHYLMKRYLSDLSINVIKKDDMNLSDLQMIVSFDYININNVNKIDNLLYISDEIEKVIRKYDISKKLFMEKHKPNKIGEICCMKD